MPSLSSRSVAEGHRHRQGRRPALARHGLERLLGCKVFLKLHVKAEERWSERIESLRKLGI